MFARSVKRWGNEYEHAIYHNNGRNSKASVHLVFTECRKICLCVCNVPMRFSYTDRTDQFSVTLYSLIKQNAWIPYIHYFNAAVKWEEVDSIIHSIGKFFINYVCFKCWNLLKVLINLILLKVLYFLSNNKDLILYFITYYSVLIIVVLTSDFSLEVKKLKKEKYIETYVEFQFL